MINEVLNSTYKTTQCIYLELCKILKHIPCHIWGLLQYNAYILKISLIYSPSLSLNIWKKASLASSPVNCCVPSYSQGEIDDCINRNHICHSHWSSPQGPEKPFPSLHGKNIKYWARSQVTAGDNTDAVSNNSYHWPTAYEATIPRLMSQPVQPSSYISNVNTSMKH